MHSGHTWHDAKLSTDAVLKIHCADETIIFHLSFSPSDW